MPEPEIARRCPTCGASIREVALFCPQCGKALPQAEPASAKTGVAVAVPATTSKNTAPLNDPDSADESQPPSMSDTVAIKRPDGEPKPARSLSDTTAIEKTETTAKTATGARVRGAVGAKIQRATTMARDVEGDVIHRARNVRRMSSVVLDEAGYDPSLRFVLVAAVLFVLFLVIVFLNKVIT